MQELQAPSGTVNATVAGVIYEPDAEGRCIVLDDDHAEQLKRIGWKTPETVRHDEFRASIPDLDKASEAELTRWLRAHGVEIPDWRELLVANCRNVIALEAAGQVVLPRLIDPDTLDQTPEPAAAAPEPAPAPAAPVAPVAEAPAPAAVASTGGDADPAATQAPDDTQTAPAAEIQAFVPNDIEAQLIAGEKVAWLDLKNYLAGESITAKPNASRVDLEKIATDHVAEKKRAAEAPQQ